jgi:hypothetical protein
MCLTKLGGLQAEAVVRYSRSHFSVLKRKAAEDHSGDGYQAVNQAAERRPTH